MVSEHVERGARLDRDGDAAIARQRFKPVDDLAYDRHQIDRCIGSAMRIELDARQRDISLAIRREPTLRGGSRSTTRLSTESIRIVSERPCRRVELVLVKRVGSTNAN